MLLGWPAASIIGCLSPAECVGGGVGGAAVGGKFAAHGWRRLAWVSWASWTL